MKKMMTKCLKRIQDRWNYIEMRDKPNLRRTIPLSGCVHANNTFPILPPAVAFQHVHVSPFHNKSNFPFFRYRQGLFHWSSTVIV